MKSIITLAFLALSVQFASAQTTPAKTPPAAVTPSKEVQAKPSPMKQAPNTGTVASPVPPRDQAAAAPQPEPGKEPAFKWSEETWDFGNIPQGTPVTHEFKFTNVGKGPLVISKCDKSCGCTTPKWTTEPVMPGKDGSVSATFNAAAAGSFNKTVTVHSNTGKDVVLHIKGVVIAKEGAKEVKTDDHSGHQH